MYNATTRNDGFLVSPYPKNDPLRNQAEAPLPSRSVQGTALRRGMLKFCPPKTSPQTATNPELGVDDWRGKTVREQSPLFFAHKFRDLFGTFVVRPALSVPVINQFRYQGELPMDQQPKLKKPYPWEDPTLGRP